MISFFRSFSASIVVSVGITGFLCGATALSYVRHVADSLPPVETLKEPAFVDATRILDMNGDIVGQFHETMRHPVSLASVPYIVKQAFISAEDQNYMHHSGVDPVAIARAMMFDIMHHHEHRMIGASTITQQVVKNMMTGDERSFDRKIKEAILALRVNSSFGKERVLELYFNNIYLGYGAYGIESASEVYFHKKVSELNLSEAAYLAILPKGPSNYDPIRFPKRALERRHYVLERMLEDGIITQSQLEQADREPLPSPSRNQSSGVADNYFSEDVRRELVTNFGAKAVYDNGLVVKTSMDAKLQKIAEHVMQHTLISYDKRHGWRGIKKHIDITDLSQWKTEISDLEMSPVKDYPYAVVLNTDDNHLTVGFSDGTHAIISPESYQWIIGHKKISDLFSTGDVINVHYDNNVWNIVQLPEVQGGMIVMNVNTGQILAVSGGFSEETSSFNRATQSMRQIGSTFKPFIFLTGFEHGYDSNSPVLDLPITIDTGNGQLWTPGADGGHGWGLITAQKALENSRNLASVRMLYDLGLDSVEKTAQDFGIYNTVKQYSAALGAQETTDMKLTAAYAMIANGGHKIYPSMIDKVTDAQGHVLMERKISDETVANELDTARLTSVLTGVIRHGTGYQALHDIKLPIAGKTGTSNNNMDAWFVGYTPDIAIGVYVGYDKPQSLGAHEFGGLAAAPAFGEFIKEYNDLYPITKQFNIPQNTHFVNLDPNTGYPSKNGTPVLVNNDDTKMPEKTPEHVNKVEDEDEKNDIQGIIQEPLD